ncbi:MAG TPA: hypothetical protein VNS09_10425 [Solirubrobacter sp.]|nr:hypothetical protein [Solirubrobacter sp.]
MSSRAWLTALLVVAIALGAGTPARAGQLVFERDSSIWAAADDGSGAHPLIDVLNVPGMQRLSAPYASADGRVVVFSGRWAGAVAEQRRSSAPGAIGGNADGVYRWTAGTVTRLTAAPVPCPLEPCYSATTQPELAGDQIVAGTELASWEPCASVGWCVKRSGGDVLTVPQGTSIGPACGGIGVGEPSANPVRPAAIAYVGCSVAVDGNLYPALFVEEGGTNQAIAYDDATQADPSWSLDGTRIVAVEGGTNPGLWTYAPGAYVLAGTGFASPRFVPGDRIAFVAQGDVWTVPASCRACTFPADATRLTALGGVVSVAWTPAAQLGEPPAAPPAAPAPAAHAALTLPGGRHRASHGGRVKLRLACAPGAACAGRLKLTAGKHALGSARFAIAAGHRRTVTVRLTASGRALLRHRHHLKVILTAPGAARASVTLLAPT